MSNGNNEVFRITTINESQYEDGRACKTQKDTHIDRRTESTKEHPNSSEEKDTKSSGRKQKRAIQVQSNAGNKPTSKGKRKQQAVNHPGEEEQTTGKQFD